MFISLPILKIFKRVILLFVVLSFFFGAKANHINGIYLQNNWVSGNTYNVVLTVYGNCGSTTFHSLDTSRPVICVFDSSHYDTSITLTLTTPAVNVSNVCPSDMDSTTCTNLASAIPGTKKFTYSGLITLPSASKCWRFVFTGHMGGAVYAGRVATTNISGVTIIYLQDTLNNLVSANSSPNLTVIPSPYYCQNNPDNYNPGAVDPTADSLKFALVPALSNGGGTCTTIPASVSYLAGYSGANPLHYTAGTFAFGQPSGQISFTPDISGTYAVVYNIKKYQGGVVVGTSQREMYFLVQPCVLSAPTGTITSVTAGTLVDSIHYSICQGGGPFSLNVTATEPNSVNTVTITASGVPYWATLTILNNGTNHPTVTFTGNATTAAPGVYSFTLSYLDNNCPIAGSNTIAYSVTILPKPSTITFARDSVCIGSSINFSSLTAGGIWSTANSSVANVVAGSGVVTGVSAGSTQITYSSGGCYTDTNVYVLPLPAPITGGASTCIGSTITLADATVGGTWSSSSPSIATVSATGVVTGVSTGTTTITYSGAGGCYVTLFVTIGSGPAAIGGSTTVVCAGSVITYTDATVGGTWTSSNTAIATINGTGNITGIAAGTSTITYSVGTCYVTKLVTVNPLPSIITGGTSVCIGNSITLADSVAGGNWTSSATSVATVSSSGVVAGLSAGTSTISYVLPSGCSNTILITVSAAPAPISGTFSVCTGLTTSLADATAGGTWTSTSAPTATISGTGVVTGVVSGTSTISYVLSASCWVTAIITVNTQPAAITGIATICLGSNTTLADATAGGIWSSATPAVATVAAGGIVNGTSIGTSTISYTLSTCSATVTVTVNTAPGAIAGTLSVCNGATTALTDGVSGGTWSSASPTVATVSATGVVTGVSVGTAIISYSLSSCVSTAIVTVNTQPAAITGVATICLGSNTTLADTTAGGIWSSATPVVATVAAGGIVTGTTIGTSTISDTLSTCSATVTVTVNTAPGTIAGTLSVCNGATTALTDGVSGGTWSSASPTVATVSAAGVVTGVSVGTAIISYSLGTCVSTAIVTVNTQPAVINGALSLCELGSAILTDSVSGGNWNSQNVSVATISVTGIANALVTGSTIISYTLGSCTSTATLTVNSLPNAGVINGGGAVCAGSTLSLSDTTLGGTWTSMNPTIALASAAGVITGVASGTDSIKYSVTNGCGTAIASTVITVNPLPDAGVITGPSSVCAGSAVSLSDSLSGGVWSSSNPAIATISVSGVVTGLVPGTDTIYYTVTNGCGTSVSNSIVTVNEIPVTGPISGPTAVCAGSFISLADTSAGGFWTSGDTSIATVSAGGVVSGVGSGVVNISYTVSTVCGTSIATYVVTVGVSATSGVISGPSSLCVGATGNLTETISGGTWSVSNTNATISTSGVVTGVSTGAVNIFYAFTIACGTAVDTFSVVINPIANPGTISGSNTVCVGSVSTLSASVPGGAWSISNNNATVGASGIITGLAGGIDTVVYGVTNMCGTSNVTFPVTINAYPIAGVISGPGTVCQGSVITLSETEPGGVWTSGNVSVSAVSGDLVTGIGAGTDTISYSITNSCGTVGTWHLVTVNPLPVVASISGGDTVCAGSTLTLAETTSGGVWTSSNSGIATVTGGVVTGIAVGADSIVYSLSNICGTSSSFVLVNILAIPYTGPIAGPSSVCQGHAITLLDPTPGGLWTASNGNAILLAPGIVSGMLVGTDTITYKVVNSCGTALSQVVVTINPIPSVSAIAGYTKVCTGATITLSNATTGGIWLSSNAASASVSASGVVSGIVPGFDTISYEVTNSAGCLNTVTLLDTVLATPGSSPITGSSVVCEGSATTLSNLISSGSWTCGDTSIAVVGLTNGVVTGIAAGTTGITYSAANDCGSGMVYANITVSGIPIVGAISGSVGTICAGASSSVSDATPGGTWSSSDTTIATVNTTGLVSGYGSGNVTISYTVTNSAGCAGSSTYTLSFGNSIGSSNISPSSATICDGHAVALGLFSASSGLSYQWMENGVDIPGATNYNYSADSAGFYSVTINNGMCSETVSGASVVNMATPVIGYTAPNTLFTGYFYGYQWYLNGTLIPGATSAIYHFSAPGTYVVVVSDSNGCSQTSSDYVVNSGSGSGVKKVNYCDLIRVFPNPSSSLVYVESPVELEVKMLAPDGKIVLSQRDVKVLDVSVLADGLYMILFYNQDGVVLKTEKFVKTK